MLLDANFGIVWQSESSWTLGWNDLIGHNAVEYVHPDDLELVLQTMVEVQRTDEVHLTPDLAYAPRVRRPAADRLARSVAHLRGRRVHHLADPEINAVLCVGRLIRDRSDVAKAIELLGTSATQHGRPDSGSCSCYRSRRRPATRSSVRWPCGARTTVDF